MDEIRDVSRRAAGRVRLTLAVVGAVAFATACWAGSGLDPVRGAVVGVSWFVLGALLSPLVFAVAVASNGGDARLIVRLPSRRSAKPPTVVEGD
jgi:hypothetical protein